MSGDWTNESLSESLRGYFLACPALESVFSVDRVEPRPPGGSIRQTGGGTLRRYLDGGQMCEALFDVCVRSAYGADTQHLLDTRRRLDALGEWVHLQTAAGELPVLSRGRRALRLETLGEAALEESDVSGAVWALPCRMVYSCPAANASKEEGGAEA